jgi:membrane-bound metal-dependent hydrolase YbcI (DUF457 family)
MWRSHMVIGASAWLGLQTVAGPVTGTGLDWRERACGAVVAAGGALLCDLDTPASRLANALGPLTRVAARTIGRVFGGHRQGTHSLLFCAATGMLAAALVAQDHVLQLGAGLTLSIGELAALAIAYFAAALTVALLLPGVRGLSAAAVTLALVAVAASTQPPVAIVSTAATIGCSSHLLADALTPEGITPLWPLSKRRLCVPLIGSTGDWREGAVVLLIAAATVAIAWSTA